MHFSILTRVSVGMSGSSLAFANNFVKIQPNKSFSSIYNTKLLTKEPKALHLGRVVEQKPSIRDICSNCKKNSCC